MLISNELRSQLITHTYSRTLRLEFNGVTIQSSNIISDTLEIESSIMDESTLVIGGCIASRMSIKVFNVNNLLNDTLSGVQIKAYITQNYTSDPLLPSDTLYPASDLSPGYTIHSLDQVIFTGYIYSIERQKQRNVFEILAYDEMQRMSETKCKELIWGYLIYRPTTIDGLHELMLTVLDHYARLYETDTANQFISINNLETEFQYRELSATTLNITTQLFSNAASDELSVNDLLKAHSELNSRFAYINSNGELAFVTFWEIVGRGQDRHTDQKRPNVNISSYNNLLYKDYYTAPIKYFSFPYNGGDSRFAKGNTNDKRYWYISDNIITKCSSDPCAYINNLYDGINYITGYLYQCRPYSVTVFGEWWIEPGDIVSLPTNNADLPTLTGWVLTRRIKGVSGMKVELEAKGSKYFTKDELIYNE